MEDILDRMWVLSRPDVHQIFTEHLAGDLYIVWYFSLPVLMWSVKLIQKRHYRYIHILHIWYIHIYTHGFYKIENGKLPHCRNFFLFSLTSTFEISTWWKISSLVDTFHHLSNNSFIGRHCGIDTDFHDKYNFTLVWITHGPFDNLRICQIT